jgi:hypothetical protein
LSPQFGEKTLALTPALSRPTGEGESFAASCRAGRAGFPDRFAPERHHGADAESGMRTLQQARRFEGKIGFNISGTADIPVQVEASGGWEALGPRCSQVR